MGGNITSSYPWELGTSGASRCHFLLLPASRSTHGQWRTCNPPGSESCRRATPEFPRVWDVASPWGITPGYCTNSKTIHPCQKAGGVRVWHHSKRDQMASQHVGKQLIRRRKFSLREVSQLAHNSGVRRFIWLPPFFFRDCSQEENSELTMSAHSQGKMPGHMTWLRACTQTIRSPW